jgi:hypothetical protein
MTSKAQLTRQSILDMLNHDLPELRQRYGVRRIGLFGSFATGHNRARSDVDILVELEQYNYRVYVDLLFHLERLLGRKVDLVIERSIKPAIREQVISETIYVEGINPVFQGYCSGN